MKWFCFVYAVLCCTVSWAQTPVTYTVKAGVNVLDVVPVKDIYQYPAFVPGTVMFKDGRSSPGRLNYNCLNAEMQFISPKGDTLSLADEQTVRYIVIDADTFYYSEGYVRLIKGGGSVKLGEKVFFKEFVQKPGAYGLSSATTASNTLTSILAKRSVDLDISQEIVLVKNTSWFMANKFNDFMPADKKNIVKILPRQKQAIDEYLRKNDVNFNKEEDLKRLTDFLNGL